MLRIAIPSRLLGVAAALVAAFLILPGAARGAAEEDTPPQAFVKVNQFYLLYTYPVVPYLNDKGVMMVGLEGFGRALFDKAPPGDTQAEGYGGDDYGRVTTTPAARTETLTLGVHVVTFTADSATARADGAEVALEAPARWDAPTRQMVVPAQGLARCLGLDAAWDPAHGVLRVTAPDRMTSRDAGDGGANRGAVPDALVPWRVTYHATGAPANAVYPLSDSGVPQTPWLMFEAMNVSGVPAVREELNVLILFSKAGMSSNLDSIGNILGHGDGPSPTILPGGVRRFSLALQREPNIDAVPLCVVSHPDVVGWSPAVVPPAATAPSFGFIDPNITGEERVAVTKAMAGLRPEDRQNVIVEEPDGTVYANRPQLRKFFAPLKPLGSNLYEDPSGRKLALPAPQPKPKARATEGAATGMKPNVADPSKPYGGSGPYVRLYTTPPANDSGQGFAYESADVYLPGVSTQPSQKPIPGVSSEPFDVSENPTDCAAATVYMGGWSAGASPIALDVGFTHEGASSKNFDAGWNDDWFAFWGEGGTPANPGTLNLATSPRAEIKLGDAIRFASNQTVTIKFYITGTGDSTQLNFVWAGSGYDFQNYTAITRQSYALVKNVPDSTAWNTGGQGIVLKSMTSIAQEINTGSPADDFFDGSFVQNVFWSNCMLSPTGTGTPKSWNTFGPLHLQKYPSSGVSITSSVSPQPTNKAITNRIDSIIVP